MGRWTSDLNYLRLEAQKNVSKSHNAYSISATYRVYLKLLLFLQYGHVWPRTNDYFYFSRNRIFFHDVFRRRIFLYLLRTHLSCISTSADPRVLLSRRCSVKIKSFRCFFRSGNVLSRIWFLKRCLGWNSNTADSYNINSRRNHEVGTVASARVFTLRDAETINEILMQKYKAGNMHRLKERHALNIEVLKKSGKME